MIVVTTLQQLVYCRLSILQPVPIGFLVHDEDLALAHEAAIRMDRIAALDDAVLNVGVVADVHIVQDDRILDGHVVADVNLLEENRVLHDTVDDAARSDQTVFHDRVRIVLCRRKVIHLGIDIRVLAEEVINQYRLYSLSHETGLQKH